MMLTENIEDVAMELADHLRGARASGGKDTRDLDATLLRLYKAQGESPSDILALLAYSEAAIFALLGDVAGTIGIGFDPESGLYSGKIFGTKEGRL